MCVLRVRDRTQCTGEDVAQSGLGFEAQRPCVGDAYENALLLSTSNFFAAQSESMTKWVEERGDPLFRERIDPPFHMVQKRGEHDGAIERRRIVSMQACLSEERRGAGRDLGFELDAIDAKPDADGDGLDARAKRCDFDQDPRRFSSSKPDVVGPFDSRLEHACDGMDRIGDAETHRERERRKFLFRNFEPFDDGQIEVDARRREPDPTMGATPLCLSVGHDDVSSRGAPARGGACVVVGRPRRAKDLERATVHTRRERGVDALRSDIVEQMRHAMSESR